MSGFTSGPWEFHPHNIGTHYGTDPYWGIVGPNDGESIVKVPCGFRYRTAREGECAANAALIAAAPELYEALRLLVADVADYAAWQRPCHALDVARAALAKAVPPGPPGPSQET